MELEKTNWNTTSYCEFIEELQSYQDLKYQRFHSKLILNGMPLIGVRTPILKQIAKKISRGDYQSFIKHNQHHYYEEIVIHGLILGNIKTDFENLLVLLEEFLPYNQNWAINDIVCAGLKQFRKNQEIGFSWILKLLQSGEPWTIRFGLILLLDYYINDHYIDKVLQLASKSYINFYYVYMAVAWLLSICYIKYPKKTIILLQNNTLNDWIHNKTISKIRDSYRVSQNEKDYLKTLIR